jgi:hypothetical protein
MKTDKTNIKNTKGFMSLVALGIFAILMVFGLSLQKRVIETYEFIRNSNDHITARILSDSVIGILEAELKDNEGKGFNMLEDGGGLVECNFGGSDDGGGTATTSPADPICNAFAPLIDDSEDVQIKFKMKAHAREGENLVSGISDLFGTNAPTTYYTVPFPGTGNAGTRCNMYSPVLGDGDETDIPEHLVNRILGTTATGTATPIPSPDDLDQIDYSCNWNKLIFGSSMTDRVALPLYYYEKDIGGELIAVNPFKVENGAAQAEHFVLRLRTPCKPCNERDNKDSLICNDPTVCEDRDRYKLDANLGDPKILVQWQLSGKCEKADQIQDCTMIADTSYTSFDIGGNIIEKKSGIFDIRFKNASNFEEKEHRLLTNASRGYDISEGEAVPVHFLESKPQIPPLLSTLEKPILTLFLSNPLIANEGGITKRIPYLEYQLITDHPVSNSSILMKVEVIVNNNAYRRTLEKRVQTPLIDFALQN